MSDSNKGSRGVGGRAVTAYLMDQPWPGQVRELLDTVRVVAYRRRSEQAREGIQKEPLVLGVAQFSAYLGERRAGIPGLAHGTSRHSSPVATLPTSTEVSSHHKRPRDLTREEIELALQAVAGNKTRAAKALGLAIGTLKRKMAAFGL